MTFTNTPLTLDQVRNSLDQQPNGVYICGLGEDGEMGYLALGYVDDRALRIAIASYGGYSDDFDPDDVDRGWVVLTPHHSECAGVDGDDASEPCNCDEYGWWISGQMHSDVAESNAKRQGAISVTQLAT